MWTDNVERKVRSDQNYKFTKIDKDYDIIFLKDKKSKLDYDEFKFNKNFYNDLVWKTFHHN